MARAGESRLRIYPHYPDKPATVDFVLEQITDVELCDFSQQNVISSLAVEAVTDQTGHQAVRLILSPCYGLAGRIDAKQVRIEVVPGKSPDGIGRW
jgi:hypothetical protein